MYLYAHVVVYRLAMAHFDHMSKCTHVFRYYSSLPSYQWTVFIHVQRKCTSSLNQHKNFWMARNTHVANYALIWRRDTYTDDDVLYSSCTVHVKVTFFITTTLVSCLNVGLYTFPCYAVCVRNVFVLKRKSDIHES